MVRSPSLFCRKEGVFSSLPAVLCLLCAAPCTELHIFKCSWDKALLDRPGRSMVPTPPPSSMSCVQRGRRHIGPTRHTPNQHQQVARHYRAPRVQVRSSNADGDHYSHFHGMSRQDIKFCKRCFKNYLGVYLSLQSSDRPSSIPDDGQSVLCRFQPRSVVLSSLHFFCGMPRMACTNGSRRITTWKSTHQLARR